MNTKTQSQPIGVDDGWSGTKLVWCDNKGVLHQENVKTAVRYGRTIVDVAFAGGAIAQVASYTVEGAAFTAGASAQAQQGATRVSDYHESPLNRVMIHHALRTIGFNASAFVATGLPVADYYLNGEPNTQLIENKQRNVRGPIASDSGTCVEIVRAVVAAQAVAAYVDYLTQNDGQVIKDRASETVAIVDVGGNTTDIVVVGQGGQIDRSSIVTRRVGVLDVEDAMAAALRTKFSANASIPESLINRTVLGHGHVEVLEQKHDLSDSFSQACQRLSDEVGNAVTQAVGRGLALSRVVVVGGGADLVFASLKQQFPNAVIAPDPVFANARGLFKLASDAHAAQAGGAAAP